MRGNWARAYAGLSLAAAAGLLAATAPGASAHQFDPPSWWNDGKSLVEKRGGSCQRTTTTSDGGGFSPIDPATGQPVPRGTYTEETVRCGHKIPLAVAKMLGANPNATSASESCSAAVQNSADPNKRRFDDYGYVCFIVAHPGTDARPNLATWQCAREKSHIALGEGETTDEAVWTARKTKLFPKRSAPTLARCLAPRVALDDGSSPLSQALGKGLKLPVTCSQACTVEVTGGAKRVKKKLKAGKRTVLRIKLKRRGRKARSSKLRIKVSAAGYLVRSKMTAKVRGSKVRLSGPDTLSLKR